MKKILMFLLWCFMGFIALVILIGLFTDNKTHIYKITMQEFNKIEIGMPYDTVVKIIGEKGELTGESKVSGISGISNDIMINVMTWKNPDGSSAIINFQNGKVDSKVQGNLP